jgi:hypothetical protein
MCVFIYNCVLKKEKTEKGFFWFIFSRIKKDERRK